MDHPRPWLRLVDADDLDDSPIDFDNLKVRNAAGDKLGTVDGFVVDRDSGRPYYVVVDTGGWFKSKHFLLPIGHAQLDDDRDALVTDLDKQRVNRFPGFDKGEFDKLSESDLQRMGDETSSACGFSDVTVAVWDRSTYRQPDWWHMSYYRKDLDSAAGRGDSTATRTRSAAGRDGSYDDASAREREAVTARGGDTSPYPGGRAQPGDVVGFETGGERTHIGDTSDDENKRRREAEEDAAKKRRG